MLAARSFYRAAAMPNEPAQLNLGSLRNVMLLTLHTHHAARIWHGRPPAEDRSGIVGLNGFVALMNKLKRGVEQDDPYSDGWMPRIEEKLEQTKASLQTLREQVDEALAWVPPALSLGENLNVQPVKLPLFINSPLGFKVVYLLADFDELARRLILAHHTALINRNTLERGLNDGAHALRSLFSLAQQYRYFGATREDFAAMNAVARRPDRAGARSWAAAGARASVPPARCPSGPTEDGRRDELPALAQPRSRAHGGRFVGGNTGKSRDARIPHRRPVCDGRAAHRAEHTDQPAAHPGARGARLRQQDGAGGRDLVLIRSEAEATTAK